eukprot:1295957-Lingulodinium_polyedra.AAC.1
MGGRSQGCRGQRPFRRERDGVVEVVRRRAEPRHGRFQHHARGQRRRRVLAMAGWSDLFADAGPTCPG